MKYLVKKYIVLRVFLVTLLLFTFVCMSAYSYASAVSYNISDSVFRLHVIANSNSEEDQNLKYLVRDSLLEYMNKISSDVLTKDDAIKVVEEHIDEFYYIANQAIIQNGYNYSVKIAISKCDFPTKYYGDIVLPSGIYDALRVEIGAAEGRNWWCVMFPPLCFVDVSSGTVPDESKGLLQDSFSNEEYDLITAENTTDISLKFKIVEFIENLKISMTK